MDSRTNVIAMMVLGAGIVALGSSIFTGKYFADHRPEKMGYVVEGVVEEGGAAAASAVPIATLLAAADPARGAEVFKKCAACHTVTQGGANGVGPNLWAVVGAKHGHTAGFAYSEAITSIQGPWTFDQLDAFLANPRRYAPGTKMTFAGLSKPEDRADVIVYLNTLGSNLPLPAAPAAAPEGQAPTGGEGATPAAPEAGAAPAAKDAATGAAAAPVAAKGSN